MALGPAPGKLTRTAVQSGRNVAPPEADPEALPGVRYLATDGRVAASEPVRPLEGDDDDAPPVAPAGPDPDPTALVQLALAVHHARPAWPWVRCAAAARLVLVGGPSLDRRAAALACGDALGRALAEAAAREHDRRVRAARSPEVGLDSWASSLLITPRGR